MADRADQVRTCCTLWRSDLLLAEAAFWVDCYACCLCCKQGVQLASWLCRYPLKLAGFWTAQSAWAWVCLLPVTCCQVCMQLDCSTHSGAMPSWAAHSSPRANPAETLPVRRADISMSHCETELLFGSMLTARTVHPACRP